MLWIQINLIQIMILPELQKIKKISKKTFEIPKLQKLLLNVIPIKALTPNI